MATIRFSHPAGVFDFRQTDPETGNRGLFVEDPSVLRTLHGLHYADELFADYLGDGAETRPLVTAGVSGGTIKFVFDERSKQLVALTEYLLVRSLSKDEAKLLLDYTVGQWSDGIGANFFQERMHEGLAPQVLVMESALVSVQHGT